MLKKLVKYGNSTALVLDKAILELLNMREGSIVKITTDGKSLILTPHEPAPVEQVSSTVIPDDVWMEAVQEHWKKQYPGLDIQKTRGGMKTILAKYADEIAMLEENEEYKKELEQLKKRHKDTPANLMSELNTLQRKYSPQLQTIDQEMNEFVKGSTFAYYKKDPKSPEGKLYAEEMDKLKKTYMAIHEKYKSAQEAFTKLLNNEEYQHESALLAQQQTKPIDMKKYALATQELVCKYIPEWRAYQDEMLKAAQEYEKRIGEQISPTITPESVMLEASAEHLKEQFKKLRPEATAEELQRMVAETKGRMAKYTDESAKLQGNKEYKKELEQLQKKYRDSPTKLMHEISALQHKYAPQLRAVCQELDTSPLAQIGHETVKQTHANEEIEKLQKTYMAIHEKYKSARDAFDKLQNNEEYLHESALLAQQQTKPIDMKKYVLATQELLCKYIPQWRAYQDEMLEAAQEYENRIGTITTDQKK